MAAPLPVLYVCMLLSLLLLLLLQKRLSLKALLNWHLKLATKTPCLITFHTHLCVCCCCCCCCFSGGLCMNKYKGTRHAETHIAQSSAAPTYASVAAAAVSGRAVCAGAADHVTQTPACAHTLPEPAWHPQQQQEECSLPARAFMVYIIWNASIHY